MAFQLHRFLPLFLLIAIACAAPALRSSERLGGGGIVGGRTKVKDVANDKEVQDLGRFAVEEFDRRRATGEGLLSFKQVVAAESQVVAGIKYYLTVAAKDGKGKVKKFEAVIVVKAWLKSRELVSFTPYAN